MKNLTLLFLFSIPFITLAQQPKPDNKILRQRTEFVGWEYDPNKGTTVQRFDTFYMVRPTWKQARYYASKRKDQWATKAAGGAILVGTAVAGYGVYSAAVWLPEVTGLWSMQPFFLGAGTGTQLWVNNAYGVKWNNDKWISKKHYDFLVSKDGSIQKFWDSLEFENRIVDGPYK